MKNILVIHPALVVGGADSVLISYLNILAKHSDKYQVELVLLEDRQNHNISEISNNIKITHLLNGIESEFFIYCLLRLENHPESAYFHSWFTGIQEKINALLLEKINTNHYDLIIDFHTNHSAFENFLNKYDVYIPTIRWIHSNYYLERWENDPNYYSYILSKYKVLITIADEMSERVYRILNQFNLNDKVKILRLYNPLDIDTINKKSLEKLSEQDEILLQENFLLQVSRLEKLKNIVQLVEIYYELKQRGIKEKLYIIGDGQQKEEVQETIIQLGLENECFVLGERANPFPFMRKAKLFLHTSLLEGLGMVLIESMVCNTPVVAYSCLTGPRDILDNGKYGELIPINNKQLFIEKTYELLMNNEKYLHYMQLLPEAIERFKSSTIEKQLLELIENVMNKTES